MKDRVLYYDFLRVLATIAVVMLHISSVVYDAEPGSADYWTGLCFNAPTRWAVPVFVMISGALWLNPQKTITLKSLYFKYILRLLIIYLVWVLLYTYLLCPTVYWFRSLPTRPYHLSFVYDFPGHLWFVPMLIGVYMLIPILKVVAGNRKVMDYFLVLWFVFAVLSFFHGMVADATALLQVNLIVGYSGYFLLGYRISITEVGKHKKAKVLAFFFFSLVLMCAVTVLASEPVHYLHPLAPTIILLSASVFLLAKCMGGRIDKAEGLKKVLDFVRADSLGIYLIHPFFIDLFFWPCFTEGISPVASIPLFTVAVFVMSLFTIKLLRSIPLIRYVCS